MQSTQSIITLVQRFDNLENGVLDDYLYHALKQVSVERQVLEYFAFAWFVFANCQNIAD